MRFFVLEHSSLTMCLLPKTSCYFQCVNLEILPPGDLIAGLMQLSMMPAAERHGELVTYLKTDGPRLRKPQMMRIGGLPTADQTWLSRHEF
jgi:hypothetical protein